jgi:hypothetical protein
MGTTLRHLVTATWDDVPHLTKNQKDELNASLKPHEREARSKGIPVLGEGAIFPVADEAVIEDPFEIPKWWRHICGLDFGYDHPFGAVDLAYDPDKDCIHLTREYRERHATPIIHAAALKVWGKWLPWAWPPDGFQHDKGSGEQLAEQYRRQDLNLLWEHAKFEDGTVGVEAGVSDMLQRMQTGRWKVFRTCPLWMEEKRLYHRKRTDNGRVEIVKLRDDLISASRYALMMMRYAEAQETAPRIIDPHRDKFYADDDAGDWKTA